MTDNTAVRIANVQPMANYTLQLKWQNGRRLPDIEAGFSERELQRHTGSLLPYPGAILPRKHPFVAIELRTIFLDTAIMANQHSGSVIRGSRTIATAASA